jgi:autotransporter passenger strand-loop-strand repeat protein
MTVLAHGFASGTTIGSGGTEFVSGGTDFSADVKSGGVLQVRAGGSAIVAAVESGGEMIVFSGGSGIGLTVASGGSGIVSAGGVIVLTGGGTSEIDGLLVNSGAVLANSGTLLVSGGVVNSGDSLFASGAGSLIYVFGAVTGVTKIGNGVVDFEGSSGENVTFLANGSGGLVLADSVADPTAYAGRISGFGGANHANKFQFIDLASVTSNASVSVSYVPFASHTSGTLFVSSGGSTVAEITFLGSGYVTSNFHITSGAGGTVEITDPLAAQAQGGIAFGAATTLAYSQNGGKTDVSLTAAHGAHAAVIALLGNYMAATFVTTPDAKGHGGWWHAADARAAAATHSPAAQLTGAFHPVRQPASRGRRRACAPICHGARPEVSLSKQPPRTPLHEKAEGRETLWLR